MVCQPLHDVLTLVRDSNCQLYVDDAMQTHGGARRVRTGSAGLAAYPQHTQDGPDLAYAST